MVNHVRKVFLTETITLDDKIPDYIELERALGRAGVDHSAAEIHGICCGMLAVDQASDQSQWLAQVLEGDAQDFHFQEARALLRQLFIATRQQLNGGDMDFTLFLPTEEDDLPAQVEAMQDWCQGFGLGIATAGIHDFKHLPEDSRDWLEDVVRIGASGELDLDNEEESENALIELLEYLRVGVMMMTEEMQPMKAAPQVH